MPLIVGDIRLSSTETGLAWGNWHMASMELVLQLHINERNSYWGIHSASVHNVVKQCKKCANNYFVQKVLTALHQLISSLHPVASQFTLRFHYSLSFHCFFLLDCGKRWLQVHNDGIYRQDSIPSNRAGALIWHCSNDLSTRSKSDWPTCSNVWQNAFLQTINFWVKLE